MNQITLLLRNSINQWAEEEYFLFNILNDNSNIQRHHLVLKIVCLTL